MKAIILALLLCGVVNQKGLSANRPPKTVVIYYGNRYYLRIEDKNRARAYWTPVWMRNQPSIKNIGGPQPLRRGWIRR